MKHFYARLTLVITSMFVPSMVLADDPTSLVTSGVCNTDTGFSGCNKSLFGSGNLVSNITNTLIFVVGAISVIMIVVGGLRMTLSAGNPSSIKSGRDTVIYAIVGLIIAVSAFAITQLAFSITK